MEATPQQLTEQKNITVISLDMLAKRLLGYGIL